LRHDTRYMQPFDHEPKREALPFTESPRVSRRLFGQEIEMFVAAIQKVRRLLG